MNEKEQRIFDYVLLNGHTGRKLTSKVIGHALNIRPYHARIKLEKLAKTGQIEDHPVQGWQRKWR